MLKRDCQENMKTELVGLDLTALQSCVSCHSERSVEQGSRNLEFTHFRFFVVEFILSLPKGSSEYLC